MGVSCLEISICWGKRVLMVFGVGLGCWVYCAGLFVCRVSFILQFVCWGLTCSFFVVFGVFSVEIDGCVEPRPTPVRLMD